MCRLAQEIWDLGFGFWEKHRVLARNPNSQIPTPSLNRRFADEVKQHGGEEGAENWTEDRNPGIAPIAVALPSRDGQNGVHDAGTEIAGGVDGVAGRAAERDADGEDDQSDGQGVESAQSARRAVGSGKLRLGGVEDREDKHAGADDFGSQIEQRRADGRAGAEHRQLEILVFGEAPMRVVMQPDERRTEHRAEHLGDEVMGDILPGKLAGGCESDCHGGINMCAAKFGAGENRNEHRDAPTPADRHPAGVLAFGAR